MAMTSAARTLDLYRTLERAVSRSASVPEVCDALARVLLEETHVVEAVIVAKDSFDHVLAPGEHGRQDLSEEIRQVGRAVRDPGEGWRETVWDDIIARGLSVDEKLIALVLVRRQGGLEPRDRDTFEDFCERAGVLLANVIDRATLLDRSLELATVYEIDRIRDQRLPFSEMLDRILGRVLELVPADGAAIGLTGLKGDVSALTLHARARASVAGSDRIFDRGEQAVRAIVVDAFRERALVERRIELDGGREILCMPLVLDDALLGAFLLAAMPGRRFSARDRRMFRAVCSQTDTAIFEDRERRRLKTIFQRTVSKDVFETLLKNGDDALLGRRTELTILFSDLRGFTAMSEGLDVAVVVRLLNAHLSRMTEIVLLHGGTVDKFIGDAVMALFGAPLSSDDHALSAVRCALAMRDAHQELRRTWKAEGLPDPDVGIAVHTGTCFVGPIGGEQLASYTAIGDDVNLAARLEGESGGGEILVSSAVVGQCGVKLRATPKGSIVVTGKSIPVDIFSVDGITP
jgi:class 3 adenylate cyclase